MENKIKKIYLAIPYSKMDKELSFTIANEISIRFLNKGFNVFSPITHSHPLVKKGLLNGAWDFWEKIDCQFIDWADEIVVIIPPNNGIELIETSVGVQGEINYAKQTNKPYRYFDYNKKRFVPLISNKEINNVI